MITLATMPRTAIGQTCNYNGSTRAPESPCSLLCPQGLLYNLGIPRGATCNLSLGDGLRLHAYQDPLGYQPMPTIRFSYDKNVLSDCTAERAGRIGIMPPRTPVTLPNIEPFLFPVSLNPTPTIPPTVPAVENFGEGDVFLVSTCDAKNLLLSTNNPESRIKFLTTATLGTQNERMTILNNGLVGIGTATPLEALQINDKMTFHVGANEYYLGYNQYQNSSNQTKRIVSGESSTMGVMFKEDHNNMYITNNGRYTGGTDVNWAEPSGAVKGISIGNDNNSVSSNGDKGYIGIGSAPDYNSRVVVRGLSSSSATTNAFRVTNDDGTPQTRFVVKDNGNVGIGNLSTVKAQFQINGMLGFFADNSSVFAHNAYYSGGWKRMTGNTGEGKKPASIGMSDGGITLQVGADGLTDSPITWNTALSIANDGKVTVGNLAGTGNRPVYVNASGELIDASGVGAAGGWTLGGNAISTNSYFIGTTDAQPLVFKTGGNQQMTILANGNIGIGTVAPTRKLQVAGDVQIGAEWYGASLPSTLSTKNRLSVDGQIVAKEYLCKASGWADFVFHTNYNLRTLDEVETFIKSYGHLPEIPTDAEVKDNGVNLLEMQIKLLQKVEELTLYVIELKKENIELKQLIVPTK